MAITDMMLVVGVRADEARALGPLVPPTAARTAGGLTLNGDCRGVEWRLAPIVRLARDVEASTYA